MKFIPSVDCIHSLQVLYSVLVDTNNGINLHIWEGGIRIWISGTGGSTVLLVAGTGHRSWVPEVWPVLMSTHTCQPAWVTKPVHIPQHHHQILMWCRGIPQWMSLMQTSKDIWRHLMQPFTYTVKIFIHINFTPWLPTFIPTSMQWRHFDPVTLVQLKFSVGCQILPCLLPWRRGEESKTFFSEIAKSSKYTTKKMFSSNQVEQGSEILHLT